MSLITRCPACETMFKVVPDQLRISEGWARCGQCGEVFDASQELVADAVMETTGATAVSRANYPVHGRVPAQEPAAILVEDPVVDIEVAPDLSPPPMIAARTTPTVEQAVLPDLSDAGAPNAISPVPMPELVALREMLEPPVAAEPSPFETLTPTPVPISPKPAPFALPAASDAPSADSRLGFPPTRADEDTDDAPKISFMQDGDKPSLWRKPAVRLALLLLALLLVAVLAIQFLLHERDRIVSMQPSTRPLLATLCAWSGCALGPLRQIESIVIDSSNFSKLRGENYRLAFSLKNNGPLDVAMPALELALTDAQDQAVLRRVIASREFGAPSNVLAAGSEWSSSLALSVKAPASGDRIAGYRLLAFYP